MKELIRNFSHGSEIATFIEKDKWGINSKVIKVSYSLNGISNITNEKRGWDWYSERNEAMINMILGYINEPEKEYARIELKYIEGIKPDYRKGLLKNIDPLKKIFDHYFMIWPNNQEYYPIHGDLSLDNVILYNDQVLIYDWEHFSSDAGPWGFDVFYLAFESLWFEAKRSRLNEKKLFVLADLIENIYNNGLLTWQQRQAPLRTTINFIQDNLFLWGTQIDLFPQKLPILSFTDSEIDYIDKHILRFIKKN